MNRRAFSFPELLVSVAILAFGIAGIVVNIGRAHQGIEATFEHMCGVGFARDLVEHVKGMPYDDIPPLTSAEDAVSFGRLGISPDEMGHVPDGYRRRISVREYEESIGGAGARFKHVAVEVTWFAGPGKPGGDGSRRVAIVLRTIVGKAFER